MNKPVNLNLQLNTDYSNFPKNLSTTNKVVDNDFTKDIVDLTNVDENQDKKNVNLDLISSLEDINNNKILQSKKIKFILDERSDELVLSVINSDTGEIIRKVPNDEMLELSKRLDNLVVNE